MGAFERVICSIDGAGVTAGAAAVLALRDAIRSSLVHRKDWRCSDVIRTRGGIVDLV